MSDRVCTDSPSTRLVLTLGAAALLSLADAGCNKTNTLRPIAKGTNTAASDRQQAGAQSAASQRCQTLLSSGLEMLRPEKLGFSAEPKAAVDTLNNWVRDCGKNAPAGDPPSQDPAVKRLISEDAQAAAKGDLYDRQDIEHVRNCWLFKQARSSVVRPSDSGATRAVALFELTNRIVALTGKEEPTIPQDVFDIAMIGKGTAEDRAWVFAELLRQTGLDAVILRPVQKASSASTSETKTARWLVGALVDSQIYLFDPTLGWPIPSRADKSATPAVQTPATLTEVLADDGLLRKLDLSPEKPYPLHSADLKSLSVEIISSNRYWTPRMKRLESFMSGDRSATVYVSLGDAGSRPGLLSRVAAAGAGLWKKEDVILWDYPDRNMAAVDHLEQRAGETRLFRWLPFQGPVSADFDKESMKLNIGPGTRKQMKARIAQLQGDCAGAVRNFLLVQLEELPQEIPLPEDVQASLKTKQKKPQEGTMVIRVPQMAFATNYRAAEDAKFWMGVCQIEQNMLEPATETLDAYWRRYVEGGKWVAQTALLRGMIMAKMGKYGLAVQQINEGMRALPEDDTRRTTCQLFTIRWRAARDAANGSGPNSKVENSTASEQAEAKPKPATAEDGVKAPAPAAATPTPKNASPPSPPAAKATESAPKPASPPKAKATTP